LLLCAPGDGYIRKIVYQAVPGVPSEVDRWFKAEIQGSRMRVWVDGRY
jgi:hypothetical protein